MHRMPMQRATAWSNGEQLEKPLANGDTAVLLFNRLNSTMSLALDFEDVGDTSKRCWQVRDLWAGKDLGRHNGTFIAQAVPPHGCRFLRLSAGEVCKFSPPTPVPSPQPQCPSGYTTHEGGYWANTDPCNGTFTGCREDHKDSSVEACAKKCTETSDCVAFDLYLGTTGTAACYIFHKVMAVPFVPVSACLTCVKTKAGGSEL